MRASKSSPKNRVEVEDVIKTVVPEDARPKFKPVGKIDLDKLNGRKPEKVEKEPEQKQEEPVVERPVVKPEVKKEPERENRGEEGRGGDTSCFCSRAYSSGG